MIAKQRTGDEWAYAEQARVVDEHGINRGFQLICKRYIDDPGLSFVPSPIRWLWIIIRSKTRKYPTAINFISLVAAVLIIANLFGYCAAILAATSPLLWLLARRQLQDVFIAALMLGAFDAAVHGSAICIVITVAILVASKEAAVLAIPSIATLWIMNNHSVYILLFSFLISAILWLIGTLVLLGKTTVPIIKRLYSGHLNHYTFEQQQGAPHRLLVDIMLVSPLPLLCIPRIGITQFVIASAILIFMHAISPIRNVRTILAAELLIRAMVVAILPLWSLPILILIDILIFFKIKNIIDPTTYNLVRALKIIGADKLTTSNLKC